MDQFLNDNFLLNSEPARRLYHEYAAGQPIIDYHCHLSPADIAADRNFANLTEAWLEGDHYKWRALRSNGVAERYVTGDAAPFEKFEKWAETVPATIRNPLYHWTHLELRRYFGITELLSPTSASSIYEKATSLLQTPEFSVRGLLEQMKVEVVCTTDDPADSLEHHQAIRDTRAPDGLRVFPTFRPDRFLLIGGPRFLPALEQLEACVGHSISSYSELVDTLAGRAEFFHSLGGRLSDHGMERIPENPASASQADALFRKRRDGGDLDTQEAEAFAAALLDEMGRVYHRLGWTQQFHLGAMRNNNTRKMRELGPDTGFDSIGDYRQATALSRFLDRLDVDDKLPKTILYNLNPCDNEVLGTMIGNFQDGSVPGKIQFGSGWWFLDQKDGMERQMNALSNLGLLGRFVGMLTDSRSFLSFPRHEYFRRILCNLIGDDVEKGLLPEDFDALGSVVGDICYRNARGYFGFFDN